VLVDVVLTLADGGNPLSDLAAVRNQPELFGPVASDPTAWRVVDSVDNQHREAITASDQTGQGLARGSRGRRVDAAASRLRLVHPWARAGLRDRDVECSIGPRLGTL